MAKDQLLDRIQREFQQPSLNHILSSNNPEDKEGLVQLLQQEFSSKINDFEQSLETINEELLSATEELNRFRGAELVKHALQTYQDPDFILTKTEKKALPKLKKRNLPSSDRSSGNSTPEPTPPMSEDFRQKVRVVVGNTSQLLGPESRGTDPFTHKWMVYVSGGPDCPRIEKYIQKVEVTLDPSYRPHHIVTISKPPFNLTRRGWGEFPVRVLLHFHDTRNKPFEIIHQLKLTNKLLDYQLCNGETTADISLIMSEVLQQPVTAAGKRSREEDCSELRLSKIGRTEMEDMKHVPDLSSLPLFDNEEPIVVTPPPPPVTAAVAAAPKSEEGGAFLDSGISSPVASPGRLAAEPDTKAKPLNVVLYQMPERSVKEQVNDSSTPPFGNLPLYVQQNIQEQKMKARSANMVPRPTLPVTLRPLLRAPNGLFYIRTSSNGTVFALDPKNPALASLKLAQPSQLRLAQPAASQVKLEPSTIRLVQPAIHVKPESSSPVRLMQPSQVKLEPSTTLRLLHPSPQVKLEPSAVRLMQTTSHLKFDSSPIRLAQPAQLKCNPSFLKLAQNTFQLRMAQPTTIQPKKEASASLTPVMLAQPTPKSAQVRVKLEPQSPSRTPPASSPVKHTYIASPPPQVVVKQEPTFNVIKLDSLKPGGLVTLKSPPMLCQQVKLEHHPTSPQSLIRRPPTPNLKLHQGVLSSSVKLPTPSLMVKKEPVLGRPRHRPLKIQQDSATSKSFLEKDIPPCRTLQQRLQDLQGCSFKDSNMLLSRLAELYPLCGPSLDVSLHPYSAPSADHFLHWKFWRRRAAEWQRARAMRLALLQCRCHQSDKSLSTKQLLLWCRRFGFTPHHSSASSTSTDPPGVCTLTEAGSLPAPEVLPPQLEDEEIDVESMEDEAAPQVERRPAQHPDNSTSVCLLPPQCPYPAALEFVRDCCSQIGVALRPEEVQPGIAAPVAEEMLLQACCRFASQLLQASFSKTFQRSYNSRSESVEKVTKLDICQGIQELEFGDLLTNAGLGTKPEPGSWSSRPL